MEAKKAVGTAEESGDVRFSKRVDSEGRELSEAQQEFFKDSKVRDADGKSYLYDLLDIKKRR